MGNSRKQKLSQICGYVLLGIILTFFLTINFLTPVIGEDFALIAYSPASPPESFPELLQSVVDRIALQMETWNVRLGEQLSIVFSCMDEGAFHILNSMAALYYLWLVLLYAYRGRAEKKEKLWCVFVSFSTVLLFQPALGEIFFWRTGSTNYLWSINILLTFAYPICCICSTDERDVIGNSVIKTVLLTILGFFAGFTNENTVVSFWALYLVVLLYRLTKKKKRPVWLYSSFLTLTAGLVFMLKAPSTAIRVAYYNQLFGTQGMGISDYLNRVPSVIIRFWQDNYPLVIAATLCVLAAFFTNRKQAQTDAADTAERRLKPEPFALLLFSSISCGALIMSPYIETRSFLLPDFMMTVCIAYYSERFLSAVDWKALWVVSVFSLALCVLFCVVHIYSTYREYNAFCVQRNAAVALSDEPFMWGEYPGPYGSRILTTREDYSQVSERRLESYYNKDIDTISGYIWGNDLRTTGYQLIQPMGGIDWKEWDAIDQVLFVIGWGSFPDTVGEENEIYIYLDNGTNRTYFKSPSSLDRPDVAEALGDARQQRTGFQLKTAIPEDFPLNPINEIGFCVINREKMLYGEASCGIIETAMYQGEYYGTGENAA